MPLHQLANYLIPEGNYNIDFTNSQVSVTNKTRNEMTYDQTDYSLLTQNPRAREANNFQTEFRYKEIKTIFMFTPRIQN